jgi:hypothetical protein
MHKPVCIAVAGVVALTVTVIVARGNRQTRAAEQQQARETRDLSRSFRAIPMFASNQPYFMIGDLVKNPNWTGILPLSKGQGDVLMPLDGLVRDARDRSVLADADYLDGNPADYRTYVARQDARRDRVYRHAQAIVTSGLLNQPQADFIIQHYLNTVRPVFTLRDENVQDLLGGMTDRQKLELADICDAADSRQGAMDLWASDPREEKKTRAQIIANDREADAGAMKVLTPEQLKIWSRLTSKRPPVHPPDLPLTAASDPTTARASVAEVSPTLLALSEKSNDLGLSNEQKKLLGTLAMVAYVGLQWIDKVPGDRGAQRRAEFMKHVEQFALLGILTEQQAKQLENAIKR